MLPRAGGNEPGWWTLPCTHHEKIDRNQLPGSAAGDAISSGRMGCNLRRL